MPTSVEGQEETINMQQPVEHIRKVEAQRAPYIIGGFSVRLVYPNSSTKKEALEKSQCSKNDMRRLIETMQPDGELLMQLSLFNELQMINAL